MSRLLAALARCVRALAVALLVTWQLAAATTYVALGPYEVLELADAVFTATVADVTSRVDGEAVWTVVTLDVSEWISEDPEANEEDAPRDRVVIELLGGEAEGRRLIVSGSPTWRPGEEVLVAAHADAGLASPLVGFRQGLWRSTGDGLVDDDGRYLALDANGALARADAPTAVETVLGAVRAAVAGEAPPEPAAGAGDEGPPPADDAAGAERAPDDPEVAAAEPEQQDGVAAPAVPREPVVAAYAVEDAGGPLLLSERLAGAAEAWQALAPDVVDVVPDPTADHVFEYGDQDLFAPGVLTLTLAEEGEVRVLVRPEEHPSLDAALRHEVGALLGLSPAPSGVMAMAVADPAVTPGAQELAELAAIHAFAPADLDRDGVVGFGDLLELAAAYGRSGVNLPADLDGDGDVDDDDVEALRESYAFVPPGGAAPGSQPPAEGEPEAAGEPDAAPEAQEPDGEPAAEEPDGDPAPEEQPPEEPGPGDAEPEAPDPAEPEPEGPVEPDPEEPDGEDGSSAP